MIKLASSLLPLLAASYLRTVITLLLIAFASTPAFAQSSDSDGDGVPDAMEVAQGSNPNYKDNDIFADSAAGKRAFVLQQARDFMNREASATEVNAWSTTLSQTGGRAAVIDTLLSTPAYFDISGPVIRLYAAYFLRQPDFDGYTFWLSQYRGNTWTFEGISEFFSSSPEFKQRYGALNNDQFVDLIYANVLRRAPDAQGKAFWLSELTSGRRIRGNVMAAFSEAPENKTLTAREVKVMQLYTALLRRLPTAIEFNGDVAQLNGGAVTTALIDNLISRSEYRNRFMDPNGPPPAATAKRWSDPATWGGAVPAAGQRITVPAGLKVLLDISPPPLDLLTIDGALVFDRKDLTLTANGILVHGRLEIGSEAEPFLQRATITLTGSNPAANEVSMGMSLGAKFLVAAMGGRLEIHGEPRTSWTKLNATATAGTSQITLAEPANWRAGDRIVIASSALNPDEAEVRILTAVSGTTLTLDRALAYRHFGELQTFGGKTLDARAEVGLLTRNIVIEGDAQSTALKFGGHVMVMGMNSAPAAAQRYVELPNRGFARISGVEFRRMGQFDKVGRYPLHWHFNGPSLGDYVKNSVAADTIQRGFVVHGTDGVLVENNITFNTVGHGYVVEDGTERGNTLQGNLGIKAMPAKFTAAGLATQNDNQAATFWIKSGDNRWINNHAAGGEHTAFWFDDIGRVDPARMEFRGNTAHSYLIDGNRGGDICCSFEKGALWFNGDGYDKPYRGPFTIAGATLYKNRIAMWGNPRSLGQGFADVRLLDSMVADNIMGINSHGAKNTVIVGRSANADAVDSIGAQGIQEYGHTQRLENVTFVNFDQDSAAIFHRNCSREAGNVTAIGVRLINARLNTCFWGDAPNNDMAIADMQGTMLGNGIPVTFTPISGGSRAMYTVDCPINASLGVRVCNGLLGYSNLHQRGANASLTRDDGVTLDVADVDNYPFYWTTIEGRRYRLNGDVASQPTIEFTFLGKYEDDENHRAVMVSVPATSGFAVSGVTADWFSATDRKGQTALPQAASLAALATSTSSAYYYDSASRTIHLKIWTDRMNRVFVDRR